MPMPAKSCYQLEEIAERWLVTKKDLLIYAMDGQLELSALLFGKEVVFGTFSGYGSVELERRKVFGTLPLHAQDLAPMFEGGDTWIKRFKVADENSYARPAPPIMINPDAIVVTCAERDRFERVHSLNPDSEITVSEIQKAFTHNEDYSVVTLDGLAFALGPKQAAMVRMLHEAVAKPTPWVAGQALIQGAGSESAYPGEVFKSQKHWKQLVENNGRGYYRLKLFKANSASRKAFRLDSMLNGLFLERTLH